MDVNIVKKKKKKGIFPGKGELYFQEILCAKSQVDVRKLTMKIRNHFK